MIPLATALACEYARRGRDLPLAFNRKEAKAHGEGGNLIGASLAGKRVLIVGAGDAGALKRYYKSARANSR